MGTINIEVHKHDSDYDGLDVPTVVYGFSQAFKDQQFILKAQ